MMRASTDIESAARYFVYLSYNKRGYTLNTRKLHSLLYLAQGWSFVWDKKPLFDEEFDAGGSGPKSRRIEELFSDYKYMDIPESEGADLIQDATAKETINAVWRDFGRKSVRVLSEMLQKDEAWKLAKKEKRQIKNEEIEELFKKQNY